MIHEIRACDQPGGTVVYRYRAGEERQISLSVIADFKRGLLDFPGACFIVDSMALLQNRREKWLNSQPK